MAEIDGIERCIVSLEVFRGYFTPGTQDYTKCDDAISAVRTYLDEILAKRAESEITAFKTTNFETHLDVAMSFVIKMGDSPKKSQLLGQIGALRPRLPKR